MQQRPGPGGYTWYPNSSPQMGSNTPPQHPPQQQKLSHHQPAYEQRSQLPPPYYAPPQHQQQYVAPQYHQYHPHQNNAYAPPQQEFSTQNYSYPSQAPPMQYHYPQSQQNVQYYNYGANYGSSFPIGTFYIKCKNSGLYLDAKGEGKKDGTKIIQWPLKKQKNQQWNFEEGGIIRNVHNGLVMDISGGDGPNVICYRYLGQSNQHWMFDGTHIISKKNGRYLDVKGSSKQSGAEVIVWPNNGGMNQQFELERV